MIYCYVPIAKIHTDLHMDLPNWAVLNAKKRGYRHFCEFIYFDLVFEGSGHWVGLGLEANLKVTIMFIRIIRNF